jgi:hypothetical protein
MVLRMVSRADSRAGGFSFSAGTFFPILLALLGVGDIPSSGVSPAYVLAELFECSPA